MSMLGQESKTDTSVFMTNPVVKKLSKIEKKSDNHATYRGISMKCLFFIAMVLCGVALSLFLHNAFPVIEELTADGMYITIPEFVGVIAGFVLLIAGSVVASFVSAAAPVAGTVSCISIGLLISTVANVIDDYRGLVLLAFIITLALVLSMLFLFMSGRVTVTKKFRTVVYTLFITSVTSSILIIICYFIPVLRDTAEFVMTNPLISIVLSLFGVTIATLFLLVDFDTIQKTVENKLPKKYEWTAAFGLVFTIIWLYLEVLNLLDILDN